ncbi:hypothetical protein [Achromobacter xylosoxidans]|uniref:hypothetical protein n=1 Tax=Alcaligenes xylosoxydans xylosoxydans TaxID=85698 RepID=UPI0011778703|nr:hypothetical protein [Achromobacter xylosoxidans]
MTVTAVPDQLKRHDRVAASFQERWDNCVKPSARYAIASLLSMKMLMPENNYPQTYPRLENMLVNTNYLRGTGSAGIRGQMKQRPRPYGLGAL